jgi:hypothetical protein
MPGAIGRIASLRLPGQPRSSTDALRWPLEKWGYVLICVPPTMEQILSPNESRYENDAYRFATI